MLPPLPNISGVTHRYVTIRGAKLHVAETGKGKPLVLLHGWPQHWYVWRKMIPLLSHDYKLIMPDLPGFGWSEPSKNNKYEKEQLATDLLLLIDQLGFKQVGLIAHDWGAFIGFLACLREPRKFTKFLALGMIHPFQHIDQRILHSKSMLYQIPIATPILGEKILSMPSVIEKSLKSYSFDLTIWTKDELHIYSQMLKGPAAKASSLLYRTFLLKESLPLSFGKYRQQRLHVPTTLLIGEDDPVIHPSRVKGFEAYTDDMRVEFIPNCGHFVPEEKPELVAEEAKKLFQ